MRCRVRECLGSTAIFFGVTGICLGDQYTSDAAKLTSSEVRQIANLMDEKNFDLTQAIRKANRECDGTIIMAQGKVVDAQQYAQKLETKHRDDLDETFKSGKRVVFEVTCADENVASAKQIAICPESGEVKLVRGSETFGDRYGRQVSDRERRENRTYDDPDREPTSGDWDGDGRRHEFRDRFTDREGGALGMGTIRKASDVIGTNVMDLERDSLGEIEDLAIDSQTGQIRYAVLSFGGFMGIGDKLFAVPWTAFTKRDNDTYALSIDKSRLERAPGFDKNNWPDMADQQWGREVHAFYNVQPYWEPRDRYTRGTRTGEYDFDRGEFAQHSARNMTFARALEQNDFELTDAIKKAENHTNGQAVSAHCLFASATTRTSDRNMDYDSPDDERTERSYGRTGEGEEVNVEVAIFTPGDTQNLRIVTISPRTGEVLRTRGAPLPTSGTRSDAGHDRGKMAEGN